MAVFRHRINGTDTTARDKSLNLIEGANITLTAVGTDGVQIDATGGTTIDTLDDVADVNVPSPSNGEVLTWDSTPGEWVSAAPAGGSVTAADVAFVDAADNFVATEVEAALAELHEYVDISAAALAVEYYLDDAASSDVALMKRLSVTPGVTSTVTSAALSTGANQIFATFITETSPAAPSVLHAGTYSLHVHASATNVATSPVRTAKLRWLLYTTDAAGANPALVGTSETSGALTTVDSVHDIHLDVASDVVIAAGGRLKVVMDVTLVNIATTSVVTLNTEGTYDSGITIKVAPSLLNNYSLTTHTTPAATAAAAGHQKQALIQRSWTFPGTLAVTTGAMFYQLAVAETYVGCTATVNTAPTGADLRLDVNYHATAPASAVTIWTTNTNRPTIAATAKLNSAVTAPEVTAFAAGGVLSCDVDIVGSTIAGSNLVVTLWTKVA